MGRPRRVVKGEVVYHALNRANGDMQIFRKSGDYSAFEEILKEACSRIPMRVLTYCLLPNHWHLVLWPREDGHLTEFVRWMTLTHTQRWHRAHGTVGYGHVYQGRFKSFPVQSEEYYLTLCRYVERNALQAGLVERAEEWRWSGLWHRLNEESDMRRYLSTGPAEFPRNWAALVNRKMHDREVEGIRQCMEKGRPFGTRDWVALAAGTLGLESTLRGRGRPRQAEKGS